MSDPPNRKDSPALPLETPVPLENLARLMRRAWIWTKRIAVSAIILGGAVLVLEAVHLHQLLGSVHPGLAWTVSGLLIAAVLGLSAWMLWRYLRVPPVITPQIGISIQVFANSTSEYGRYVNLNYLNPSSKLAPS